jgi:hypothetical protein
MEIEKSEGNRERDTIAAHFCTLFYSWLIIFLSILIAFFSFSFMCFKFHNNKISLFAFHDEIKAFVWSMNNIFCAFMKLIFIYSITMVIHHIESITLYRGIHHFCLIFYTHKNQNYFHKLSNVHDTN